MDKLKKYKSNHDLYKSQEEMAKDYLFVTSSECYLSNGSKKALIENFLYEYTEYFGKYQGCKYWSLKALKKFKESKNCDDLRHEHIVPRKVIKELLTQNFCENQEENRTVERVKEFFAKYLIGVILTKDEEGDIKPTDDMPDNWDVLDEWARYREKVNKKEIDIHSVEWRLSGKILTYHSKKFDLINEKTSYEIVYKKGDYNTDFSKRYSKVNHELSGIFSEKVNTKV